MTDENQNMKEVLNGLLKRERLLLHTCCAVCAGGVLAREFSFIGGGLKTAQKKRLSDFFDITLYFYNPNIDTQEEHDKRAGELEKLKGFYGVSGIIIERYEPGSFINAAKSYENLPEGGARCDLCFAVRLEKTARFARDNGFDRMASTLSISPHKNAQTVNRIGEAAANANSVPFLPADFKKENGFLTAAKTAKELDIYRQTYCGCVFSKTVE